MLPIGFANALALGFLALIPVVIALHMLRSRRPPQIISSTMLWRQVNQERVGQLALKPPVVSLPLILQLLAILLLAAALAAPGLLAQGKARHVLILLDGTTSMLATDTLSGATRFDVARSQAIQYLRELPGADTASNPAAVDSSLPENTMVDPMSAEADACTSVQASLCPNEATDRGTAARIKSTSP